MALGISAAAGSFGQFAVLPLTQWLLSNLGWHGALLTLAGVALLMVPLSAAMYEKHLSTAHAFQQSAGAAMREALRHRGYMLLTLGFFVCGFQVVFVGVHLPAYLADKGMAPHVAVTALALVGLFNIVGTYTTGWLGSRMPRRYILSAIYFGRAVVFALFFLLPISPRVGLRVRGGAGPAVAVDGAADQQHRRADLRRPLSRDAVRLHVLQPPDRQLPRRVARRPALRHHRQLRRRLVDLRSRSASSPASSTCRSTSARSSGRPRRRPRRSRTPAGRGSAAAAAPAAANPRRCGRRRR